MQNKSNNSQQIFSNEQQDLESIELRIKITIAPLQLHQLVNDRQKFMQTVTEFINLAKEKIDVNQKQSLKLALVYLRETQRVLQYAASSGKNISRQLIITTLHNQSSIYQKLWELKNCSNYLQAIIYNYDNFIRETSASGSIISKGSVITINDPTRFRMKQKLSRYNLQFCAVNSQLSDHEAALTAVARAHSLMSECINGSLDEIKMQLSKQYECGGKDSISIKMDLLMGLVLYDKKFQDKSDFTQLQRNTLKSAHFSLQIWQQNKKSKHDYNLEGSEYLTYLSNYSIGNIVEILPMKYDDSDIGLLSAVKDKGREIQKQYHVHNRIILLSTCFFSKATELRLMSGQIYRKNVEDRKLSREYRLSINYHLLAIIIVATFIPYDLKYLNQILLSYQKHYGMNLLQYKTVEVESINKIVQLLGIQLSELNKTVQIIYNQPSKTAISAEGEVNEAKNDYNLKIHFENDKLKKIQKLKSLKKITKELNQPNCKKLEDKECRLKNKSKGNKTSFSNTKFQKKQRTVSKNQTAKKSPVYKDRNVKEKHFISHKNLPKLKEMKEIQQVKQTKQPKQTKDKKNQNKEGKNKNKQGNKSKSKHVIDETEQLFFCFSKKTKKMQGVASPNSQLRSHSIGSTSAKSKNSKKSSVLSPCPMKIRQTAQKPAKSPQKRKNIGQHIYF